MRKTVSMATITFMQGFRAKTFRIITLLFIFMIGLSYVLRTLTVGHKDMMLRAFSLSALEISSLLLIIFACISSFYREKETRIQSVHLTFVSHFNHVLGRLIGNCLLIAAYMSAGVILCSIILWHEEAWSSMFIIGAYSIYLKLMIINVFASLFSILFKSSIFASLTTFSIYFSAEYAVYPLTMIRKSAAIVPNTVSRIIYHLLPNFDKIDMKYLATHADQVSILHVAEISLYSLLYIFVIFILAWKLFERHEH